MYKNQNAKKVFIMQDKSSSGNNTENITTWKKS